METSSTQQYLELRDSITITVGGTVYIIDHVYEGDRSLPEIMGDFLEQKVRNPNS